MNGTIPSPVIPTTALLTMTVVMTGLGLGIAPRQLRWLWQRPGPLLRALLAVFVVVPAIAILASRALGLPRMDEIAIVLMAICPGAPLALRRSLGAGGHRALAAGLQITVAALAVLTLPLSLALLNPLYSGHARVSPLAVLGQVTIFQLLPLALGAALHRLRPAFAARLGPILDRIAGPLLLLLLALILIESWEAAYAAEPRMLIAMAVATLGALAAGHLLGGPEPSLRTATAVSCALHNPGLALLVAQANDKVAGYGERILIHIVVTAIASLPYFIRRGRAARSP